MTRIVILDGYTLNPGDLSWDEFLALGERVLFVWEGQAYEIGPE